jgi:tRNA dimethylallyltransferase
MSRQAIYIGGATASGKSRIALLVAERLGGEIISVDSMQVYRGMDIGTAKPSQEDRLRIPHHAIDIVDVDDPFDVARFIQEAERATLEIQERGAVAIFCGGTGLYYQAYLEGLGEAPGHDLRLRAMLDQLSLDELNEELERTDPKMAERIDRQNKRRLVRAVEVIRLTGKPFSEQRARWTGRSRIEEGESLETGARLVVIRRSREELVRRIENRVDRMFEQGLVEETRVLMGKGLKSNPNAMQAIGYRQVVDHLTHGIALEETKEKVKARTRVYAKRQMTWLRKQSGVHWVDLSGDDAIEQAGEEMVSVYRAANRVKDGSG